MQYMVPQSNSFAEWFIVHSVQGTTSISSGAPVVDEERVRPCKWQCFVSDIADLPLVSKVLF